MDRQEEILERLARVETLIIVRFESLEKSMPNCIGQDNKSCINVLEAKIKTQTKLTWVSFSLIIVAGLKALFTLATTKG